VRLGNERFRGGLIETGSRDLKVNSQSKCSSLVRTDGDCTQNCDLARRELLLVCNVVHCAGKTCCVSRGEELLRIGALAIAAQGRGSRERELYGAIGAFDAPISSANRGYRGGIEGFHAEGSSNLSRIVKAGIGCLGFMIDSSFQHAWRAEILPARPLILPARQFVYPAQVEEVERGALEVLVTPRVETGPFLATCALGFADPLALTGLWACPDPRWMCAVAGGYAYLIDTLEPQRWEQLEYRPVTEIRALPLHGLLIFSGFHGLLSWGPAGRAWKTKRLSWDGIRITEIVGNKLAGFGWDLKSDREIEFEVDLKTGESRGGGYSP
jgi:hypothetical protein